MTRLGCGRASTADQGSELQIRELEAVGCERIYRDHGISGSESGRPEPVKMLDRLCRVDGVVVWTLDRLGGNMRDLLGLLDNVKAHGFKFRSLREGMPPTRAASWVGAMVQAMITIISVFAQLERGQFSVCTKAGMVVAASHGCKAGRLLSARCGFWRCRPCRVPAVSVASISTGVCLTCFILLARVRPYRVWC